MNTVESLGKQVVEMNANRRHFDRTPDQLARQILEEAQELVKEITEAMVTDNAFSVIGEIGDIYILLAQLCSDLTVDPAEAMHMKIARNERKYPDHTMNNGYERNEAISLCKNMWERTGGDAFFSHLYLDMIAC